MKIINNEVWLLNPKGLQVSVPPDRVDTLINQGFKRIPFDEVIARKPKVKIDARIVQEQWYYSGYGRLQELLDNNIIWNTESNNLIFLGYPQPLNKEPGKKYILLTAFEANRIPDAWIPLLNQYDLVLVPSGFCERIFKDSGTTAVVKKMIIGADNFILSEHPPEPMFTFIHYNSFSDYGRKGWDLVARIFHKLFPPSVNGVKLILKARKHDVSRDMSIIPKNKNIEIIVEDYNRFQMDNLLSTVNCMVFPSRGEGVGLTPLETMARAIPTIYTDAYGLTEYDLFGIRVGVRGFVPAIYDFPFDGMWVEPNEDEIREKMFSVYSHYFDYKRQAIKEVTKLKERFGERVMINKFEQLMKEYVE